MHLFSSHSYVYFEACWFSNTVNRKRMMYLWTQRREGKRRKNEFLCPHSWSVQYITKRHNLAREGYVETTNVQARFLGMETKILFHGNGLGLSKKILICVLAEEFLPKVLKLERLRSGFTCRHQWPRWGLWRLRQCTGSWPSSIKKRLAKTVP